MPKADLKPQRQTTLPPTPPVESEALFEVVCGERVELPNQSAYGSQLASILFGNLASFIRSTVTGTILCETLFSIPTKTDPDKQRRPDVAYLSKARWPIDKKAPDTDPWPAVPNLAVEVISPTDRIVDLNTKIEDYFEAGVELVWIVHPRNEMVEVYTSPLQSRKLAKSETLTAEPVLPGFQLALATLFRS